jgi:hypothetical protein
MRQGDFTLTRKSKRDRRGNRAARSEVGGILHPYKFTDENVLADELAGYEYEHPVVAIPVLDELLAGVGKDVDRMWIIYKLGD